VFDLPSAAEGARRLISTAGVADRCEVVSGNAFAAVPDGGDLYVLKSVLHDWDDAHCIQLLQNCRRAMTDGAVLMVVERRLSNADRPPLFPSLLDMTLLVLGGGRERTPAEYAAILEAAGFSLAQIVPTTTEFAVFEAVNRAP
jgi:hypothetical protein